MLGCSIVTVNSKAFQVSKNETLLVYPHELKNGDYTIVGNYTKADGTSMRFPEADAALESELDVNGGVVYFYGSSAAYNEVFIPKLVLSDGATLKIKDSDIAFGDVKNNGNSTISLLSENSTFWGIDSLVNNTNAKLQFDIGAGTVKLQNVTNNAEIIIADSMLNIYGDMAIWKYIFSFMPV